MYDFVNQCQSVQLEPTSLSTCSCQVSGAYPACGSDTPQALELTAASQHCCASLESPPTIYKIMDCSLYDEQGEKKMWTCVPPGLSPSTKGKDVVDLVISGTLLNDELSQYSKIFK